VPEPTVCAVVPTIPMRRGRLESALTSVLAQRRPVDQISVYLDSEGRGAGWTRHQALLAARTEWMAFLDDDDAWLPQHVGNCLSHAENTGADLVFPWFTVVGGTDPFPQHFGKEWDPQNPTHTTITVLVKTEAALKVGGFDDDQPDGWEDGNVAGEDWRFILRLRDAGYKISHLPERTWIWNHWSGNLSGRSWKERVKA
jgi:glycosyltransferase involved in cell wall biosynthesis